MRAPTTSDLGYQLKQIVCIAVVVVDEEGLCSALLFKGPLILRY